jgi:hypothetical protein
LDENTTFWMTCNFAWNISFSTIFFKIDWQTLEFCISEEDTFRHSIVGLVREANQNTKNQKEEQRGGTTLVPNQKNIVPEKRVFRN